MIEKKIVKRLWRYYLKKLLTGWLFWILIAFSLLNVVIPFFFSLLFSETKIDWKKYLVDWFHLKRVLETSNWSEIFGWFYLRSLTSLFAMGLLSYLSFFFSFICPIRRLTSGAKNSGEDKIILTYASPIRRWEVFLSKILAFLTYYYLASFLLFTLPLLIWGWKIENFTGGLFLTFFLLNTFLFPLLHWGIFSLLFWSEDTKKGYLLLWGALLIGLIIWGAYVKNEELVKIFGKDILLNPLVVIALPVLIGTWFFYLVWKNFKKRDY